MDRVSQLRGGAGASGSGDSTLDTTSPPSEAYMSANESSKYFSFADSSFDISPIKDVSLASTSVDSDPPNPERLSPNLSPIGKKDILDFKIGKQIDAANILSGGENIFEGNDNSFDGDELVIDDNAVVDDKADTDIVEVLPGNIELESKAEEKPASELGLESVQPELDSEPVVEPDLHLELEPDIEPEAELVIDPGPELEPEPVLAMGPEPEIQAEPAPDIVPQNVEPEADLPQAQVEPIPPGREVVLHINGNNLNAVDIGNGLYLYRKDGRDKLAAIQITSDDPQIYKLLKVRENAVGNLEVYEEFEVPVGLDEANLADNNSQVPNVDRNEVTNSSPNNPIAGPSTSRGPQIEPVASTSRENAKEEREGSADLKTEVNINGKMMKFNESRKSPVVGSFTRMTFHSTPNKEGKPLTKTMVDLQLDPNRHSDNVKKTIEVHTDNLKHKSTEPTAKEKDVGNIKSTEAISKLILVEKSIDNINKPDVREKEEVKLVDDKKKEIKSNNDHKLSKTAEVSPEPKKEIEKDDVKDKCTDSKLNDSYQEPTAAKFETNDAVAKDVMPITNNIGDVAISTVANSAVQLLATNDSSCAASDPTTEETVKKISSEIIEKPIKCTSESEVIIVKEKAQDSDKNFNVSDESKLCKLDATTTNSETKTLDSDVSSTSTNFKTNSPNINCVISSTDSIVENVSLIMTSTTQGDKKNDSDKITEVQSTINNTDKNIAHDTLDAKKVQESTTRTMISTTQENKTNFSDKISEVQPKIDNSSENAGLGTHEAKIVHESNFKTIDQVDSTSSPSHVNSSAKIEEKTMGSSISVPSVSTPPFKSPDVIAKSSMPGSEVQSVEKLSVSNTKDMRPLKKLSSEPAKVQQPVNIVALSSVPLLLSSEKDERQLHKARVIPLDQTAHSRPLEKTQAILTVDVKESERIGQRGIPPQNAAVVTVEEDTKPLEKVKHSVATSIVKPPDMNLNSSTPPVDNPLENATGIVAASTVKSPKEIANPAKVCETKLCNVEKAVLPIPKSNVISAKHAAYSVSMPAAKIPEKVAHLVTVSAVKPLEKIKSPRVPVHHLEKPTYSGSLSEIKKPPLDISSNTIIKPARSDAHIPVVANIGNKPSSKHISHLTKTEEIKKTSDMILNPKDGMAKKPVDKYSAPIKIESREIKVPISSGVNTEIKPVNNNHSAPVPFGKWTEANRQEFLNKFKEVKAPVSTNSKQIKNSNDLNRRDVLKKIDSQRAQTIINNTAKAQEKLNVKSETVFSTKVATTKLETKIPVKNESTDKKPKQPVSNKVPVKQENLQKTAVSSSVSASSASITKVEPTPREGKATATMASLIDMTIEDMINRVVVPCKNIPDEPKQSIKSSKSEQESAASESKSKTIEKEDPGSLDDIEMKMNELHGIPFVERPPHQLPRVAKTDIKTYSKKPTEKEKPIIKDTPIPKLLINEPKIIKETVIDIESEDEVIEHEPVTGDMELNKKAITNTIPTQVMKNNLSDKSTTKVENVSNRDFITEKDFDKFARRNSITYENCLTVSYDRKEPQSLVQTVKENNQALHVNSNTDMTLIEPKSKLPHKQILRQSTKDSSSKNYQSKIHNAYQSALTAKHQVAQPITIIEDKPVKVVFVESSTGFNPSLLDVQGKELSPAKKLAAELDNADTNNTDIVDSDLLCLIDENKQQDKTKTKHQRKQVLTPVEEPELELIQPNDIGIETSPKKRRKIDDNRSDKQSKNMVHKKSYLLGRNTTSDDKTSDKQDLPKDLPKEIINRNDEVLDRKDTASAIDNLVKAAELLENQAETNMSIISLSTDSQSNTPVKRGRGRPRKYPLPDGAENRTPSPQKKPTLIDAKSFKRASFSDEQDDDSSGDDIIRENWTMGKINENIVCPICNKLFRSENVVFKHVKHCTGVSPNRSDSDKSPRRSRLSQESEDTDYELPIKEIKKQSPKKRKSKDSSKDEFKPEQSKTEADKDEVIIIEDTPIKGKPDKKSKENSYEDAKVKMRNQANNHVCEFCGKTFRQLSYLVSHKLQHKKEQAKKTEKDTQDSKKTQVFSCEVCKKEFRKLHHLVQHRIIHNPDSVPKRSLRKSSSEQNDNKITVSKQHEDASAAFRCEPCDKSFRKLHHLVEHRETHDGINRQKPVVPAQPAAEKPSPPPQCEICKKTFRKLHHLIEHKEQHADTSSEKSDDKSVKSLSTKDIIHECSLCYMVFPNEHSLNKHSGICSKKKRQSKQPKDISESEAANDEQRLKPEDKKDDQSLDDIPTIISKEIVDNEEKVPKQLGNENLNVTSDASENQTEVECNKSIISETKLQTNVCNEVTETVLQIVDKDVKSTEIQITPAKRALQKSEGDKFHEKSVVPEKIKKTIQKENKIQDAPKKKTPLKDKIAGTVAKRKKTIESLPAANETKLPVESSDDDEVRYMLNPNYKAEETVEGKTFMKVRAAKRNSLQIERPNSNDHAKRRISLQHPPKISRLKPKVAEPKLKTAGPTPKVLEPNQKAAEPKLKTIEPKSATNSKHIGESSEAEALLSTDSDDSDVKYSFPKTAPEISKPVERTPKEFERKTTRKSMEKRKALVGIAKRKSLGKPVTAKHKVADPPPRLIKKRSAEAEHRCDCGQLFTSAALLARHTSVAHTPPRIRRRRDASPAPPPPPPPPPARARPAPAPKPTLKTNPAANSKPVSTRKSSASAEPTTKRKSVKPAEDGSDATDSSSRLPVRARKSSVRPDPAASTDDRAPKPGKRTGNSAERKPDGLPEKKIENSVGKRKANSTGKKSEASAAVKTRRSGAHAGVPLPAKLRKLMLSK